MSRGSGVSGQKKDERNVTEGRTLSCERPFFSEIDVLPWLQGAELRAGVDKDNRLILNMHDHIGPAIAIDIRKLDNDDVTVQVHKDKVRGIARAIIMPDYGVHLVGARHAIGGIFLVKLPPGPKGVQSGK